MTSVLNISQHETRSGLGFCLTGMNTEAEVKRGKEGGAQAKVMSWFGEVAARTPSCYSAALLPLHMPSQLQSGATNFFFTRAYCKNVVSVFQEKTERKEARRGFFPPLAKQTNRAPPIKPKPERSKSILAFS